MSEWFVAVSVLDCCASDSDHADVHRMPMPSSLTSSIRPRSCRLHHLIDERHRFNHRTGRNLLRLQGIARWGWSCVMACSDWCWKSAWQRRRPSRHIYGSPLCNGSSHSEHRKHGKWNTWPDVFMILSSGRRMSLQREQRMPKILEGENTIEPSDSVSFAFFCWTQKTDRDQSTLEMHNRVT